MTPPIRRSEPRPPPPLPEVRPPALVEGADPVDDPPLPNLEPTWTSDVAPVGRPEPVFVPEACRGAFEMLVAAGVGPKEAVAWALGGIEPAQARLQLARLLEDPTRLEAFGPKSLVIALLVRAAAGGLNGQEVRARVGDFRGLRIVRPDGVIADGVTGRALEQAGEVRAEREGWRAGTLEVGELYRDEGGVLYAVDGRLAADRARGPVFERSLDRMAPGRALDGAEQAFVSMAVGLGELIRDPSTAVEGLFQALGWLGAVIWAAPELLEQFLAMPPGDRVEAVSQLMVSVLLARSAGKASGALIDAGGASGGLGLEIQGTLGRLAITLDLRGALIGTAGVALAPAAIIGPAGVLSRSEGADGGPANSLPPRSEITQASAKRLAKTMGKEVIEAKTKEMQRLAAEAARLVERLEALMARPGLSQELRSRLDGTIDAIKDHLNQEDMIGALRDKVGQPVRQIGSGKAYNHGQEVTDGVNSLLNLKHTLGKMIRGLPPQSAEAAELIRLGDDVLDLALRVKAVVEVQP
ncbi:MAG: hypothetical protein IPG45_15775 [Deltaproteobacteria bacterium]|nr:hypothetical protein [Deltaproteobacteria bacterium]